MRPNLIFERMGVCGFVELSHLVARYGHGAIGEEFAENL